MMTRLSTFALLTLCVLLFLSSHESSSSPSLLTFAQADDSAIEIDPETVTDGEGKCDASNKNCKKEEEGTTEEESEEDEVNIEDGEEDEEPVEEEEEEEKKTPDAPAVIDPEGKEDDNSYTAPKADEAIFLDTFQDKQLKQWKYSEEASYNGEFKVGQGKEPTIAGDRGLIIPQKARKYGITSSFKGLEDMSKHGKVVIQYEVKMDEGQTCGGSYIKLPFPKFDQKRFNGDTKYSIMFGPDKCGGTNKVHFIFQSKNPNNDKYREHHLSFSPSVPQSVTNTHLYTLIIDNKESKYDLLIDGENKSNGTFEEQFEPKVQMPVKIPDPEDKKPKDWIDEKQIPDPKAKKPDDWDEDAPKKIEDEEATKPDDWEDDTPLKIADPEAKKPEDWDESEDGEWEAPLVDNPKCKEISGCGEWKKPMIANPNYKGKWTAPLIDNPKYIGEWKAREIDNPDYYKVDKIEILPIGGIAFELWTMDQGVIFDNVYIGNDEQKAKAFADATWGKKSTTEKEIDAKKKADLEKMRKEAADAKDDDDEAADDDDEGEDDDEEDEEDDVDDEDEDEDGEGEYGDEEESDEKDEL